MQDSAVLAGNTSPGRPVDRQKHEAILLAARNAFLALPYDRVSMEAIAASAGVSKVTLYAKFGTKEQLFVTAMSTTSHEMYDRARLKIEEGDSLEHVLIQLGGDFLDMMVDPQICDMWTVMIGAAEKAPDLPQQFYDNVISASLDTLAEVLRVASERGEIACDDPRQGAVQFTSMVVGDYRYKQELGILKPLSAVEKQAYVRSCVGLLIRGLRV